MEENQELKELLRQTFMELEQLKENNIYEEKYL